MRSSARWAASGATGTASARAPRRSSRTAPGRVRAICRATCVFPAPAMPRTHTAPEAGVPSAVVSGATVPSSSAAMRARTSVRPVNVSTGAGRSLRAVATSAPSVAARAAWIRADQSARRRAGSPRASAISTTASESMRRRPSWKQS